MARPTTIIIWTTGLIITGHGSRFRPHYGPRAMGPASDRSLILNHRPHHYGPRVPLQATLRATGSASGHITGHGSRFRPHYGPRVPLQATLRATGPASGHITGHGFRFRPHYGPRVPLQATLGATGPSSASFWDVGLIMGHRPHFGPLASFRAMGLILAPHAEMLRTSWGINTNPM